MNRAALAYDRPAELQATRPPERRSLERDGVRLMVTTPSGHEHARFRDLPACLAPGSLLKLKAVQAGVESAAASGGPGWGSAARTGQGSAARTMAAENARWFQQLKTARPAPAQVLVGEASNGRGERSMTLLRRDHEELDRIIAGIAKRM